MNRRFHIIITSEQGRARTFVVPKNFLNIFMTVVGVVIVLSVITVCASFLTDFHSPAGINFLHTTTGNTDFATGVDGVQHGPQLTNAYSELNRRSRAIDSILSTLDIQAPPATPGKDSGGPYTSLARSTYQDLIFKVDQELKTIGPLPLGYPVKATGISSTFGARQDPVNGEEAFHEGIDLRGNPGALVKATADGKVAEEGYSDDYGWYVMIKHDHNFTTLYAHNQKILIGQGDRVARGQTIALLGNTGRSTGPHLHYEIRHHNRPVNPTKYMNIGKLLSDNVG